MTAAYEERHLCVTTYIDFVLLLCLELRIHCSRLLCHLAGVHAAHLGSSTLKVIVCHVAHLAHGLLHHRWVQIGWHAAHHRLHLHAAMLHELASGLECSDRQSAAVHGPMQGVRLYSA